MSKEIIDELADVARQLEEQLKFYRAIGLTDIGGSGGALELASEAAFEPRSSDLAAPARPAPLIDDAMPKKKDPVGQASLFAETLPDADEAAPPKVKGMPPPALNVIDPSLEAIREDLGECTRCKLHENRTKIVFGEGNPNARLVFVGEGPGADEDATGRPFVGRAGQLLDKIIAAIGLRREDVYITNIVKCRPPGNRTPERDEVATCEQFLFRQLALISPRVIVALGSPAFQCLLRTREPITRARGQWRDWNGIKVLPTFHPAYLLRVPEKKREAWEDMKKVRDYLSSFPD